jgi:hypothetical protein
MVATFTFDADDRAFVCTIETGRAENAQPWWWFTVSGESHRFAPFRPADDDTVESVQNRVLSYYRALLARRAQALDQRSSWELRRQNLAALKTSRRS